MVRSLGLGLLAVAVAWLGGVAFAQELPPLDMDPAGAAPAKAAPHGKHKGAASSSNTGSSHLWSDLVHGSAEQRAMEQEDNDTAHRSPVDHRKDDFFSDWKGLK